MGKITKLIPTENQEQRALVKWLMLQPKLRNLVVKLNNEGERSVALGWHLKMMGMHQGASDLFIAYPTSKYHGLWLEVKRNKHYAPSERQTPTWIAQERFQDMMRSVGYAASFCFGWQEGVIIIQDYLTE